MNTNESLLTMILRKAQGMPCLHRMMNYRMTDITLGTAFKSVLILFIISHFYLSNFCTTFQNLWQMLQSNLISRDTSRISWQQVYTSLIIMNLPREDGAFGHFKEPGWEDADDNCADDCNYQGNA